MNKFLLTLAVALGFLIPDAIAQFPPDGGGGRPDPSKMMIGRVYGKVVDETGKGVAYAAIQVKGKKFDFATRTLKDTVWAGQLTQGNGEFNIEKLPVMGAFTLNISILGYAEISQEFDFGMKMPGGGQRPGGGGRPGSAPKDSTKQGQAKPKSTGRPTGRPSGGSGGWGGFGGGNFEKDLGNILLEPQAVELDQVEITGRATTTTLSLDRKSYRVDSDLTTDGGTAQDALKNVPSLSVDLDGNVSLRNGSPQILIDGRPTTLSLDQIPANSIETVEVITNPSAKFDAGGGNAGIVNIVLKKERRLGYNGSVRGGVDSRGGFNGGGDINARGEKINLFGSAFFFGNRRYNEGETDRENFFETPESVLNQTTESRTKGIFGSFRGGLDIFLSNRNTLTVGGSFVRGQFNPTSELISNTQFLFTDSLITSQYVRTSDQERGFQNAGGSVQFKHLFPKKGAEWTADVYYNQVRFEGGSNFQTVFQEGPESFELQDLTGQGSFFTVQTDFINPLANKIKLEGGLKAILQNNENTNFNAIVDANGEVLQQVTQLADQYRYDNDIYAAYLQASRQGKKFGVQLGLRAESSFFQGELIGQDSSFAIEYPFALFPSAFLTYNMKGDNQLQLAYTRRVKRPNFFQISPFIDFSDSLNLRRGEPRLLPEFTNSLELSYQKVFKNHNILASLYMKQATNLITTYQFTEYNDLLDREVVITSYTNSDEAVAYGAEVTVKNSLFGWLDVTTNINAFQAQVDATNVSEELSIDQFSAFIKETLQFRLKKGWALQLNGTYRTRASFTPSANNNPFGRGRGSIPTNSAQGYTRALWFVDASIRKSILKNKGSFTLSMSDIFATRRFGSVTITDFFNQETAQIGNPQLVRANFSYRFGKMDTSLFRRKNMRRNSQGSDMMGG
ncbi:outer membrane beta-barrel protein [Pontibacter sp. G13]|uniref:outer membrane beta-barrel protein n=1 Tax=Pontibacter sp. G13 TaxID=3074898 RepID=UPI00288AC22D|nr:outer membrane beta-barrel protein [Pontibacter sp. G13]WNJ19124.1 TonB-dependent receptor [Pontibacter sp. G13]